MPEGMKWYEKLGVPPVGLARGLAEWWKKPPGTDIFGRHQYAGTDLSSYAAGILEQTGGLPPGGTVAPPTTAEQVEARQAMQATQAPDMPAFPEITPPLTYEQAMEMQKRLGEGYYLEYDEDLGGYRVERDPRYFVPEEKLTEYQREQIRLAEEEAEARGEQQAWKEDWAEYQADQEKRAQQEMLGWYREQQQAQLQAQKQAQLAQLRTQPASWLEYASLAGETPAIQPWMMPLMPQQYEGLGAGQAIPGWQPQGESVGQLPQLTTPSAQYMSRLTPSARQQYGGYQQATTGATPSDVDWRLWSGAPPAGRHTGLTRTR